MISKKTTPLQERLTELINARLENLSLPETPASAYDPFRYILQLGGKRIRPYLVLIANGLCDGDIEEAVPAALSIELLHNFTLVHDDIMDKAETRRGKPSVHAKWDESTAILSGDLIFSKAFQQIQQYTSMAANNGSRFNEISQTFFRAVDEVCEGQALDLEFTRREDVRLEEYLTMIEKKTAFMLAASLSLGGLTAAADINQNRIETLHKIGIKAGLAFQIQDDLLDATGEPETFGKKRGGDIREGKKTYLSILASENLDTENRKFLHKVLKQPHVDDTDINRVIELYKDFHIIEQAEDAIETYYRETTELIEQFPDNDYRSALYNLVNELQHRER